MSKRRQFSPEFKANVAIESLRGDQSLAALCRKHNLNPELLRRWRQQLLDGAPSLFNQASNDSLKQGRIAELERLIGQLTFYLELGKNFAIS